VVATATVPLTDHVTSITDKSATEPLMSVKPFTKQVAVYNLLVAETAVFLSCKNTLK